MLNRRNSPSRWLRILPILIILTAVGFWFWLPWWGEHLVHAGDPVKADAIVVLAGDSTGSRILKGAELAKAGYAPVVLVSGPTGFFDGHESDYAIAFAMKRGYPASMFAAVPNASRSTVEEAQVMVDAMRARGIKSFLLLTSDYHTRRAAGIYRRYATGLEMHVVKADSPEFDYHHWWKQREGRKTIFFEWSKTVAGWLGM